MATKHARPAQPATPGRRANITSNQYFDVGRVGRKTGITLKDTGKRDDYGLESLSDIFSTPGSTGRSQFLEDDEEYDSEGSADMDGLDSPGMEVEEVMQQRQLPRLSNIRSTPPIPNFSSSPQHLPSSRPRGFLDANRELRYDNNRVRTSIEKASPFKPRHVLRRSNAGDERLELSNGHRDLPSSVSPAAGPSKRRSTNILPGFESPPIYNDDGYEDQDTLQYATREEIKGAIEQAGKMVQQSPLTPKKRRVSQDVSVNAANRSQATPAIVSQRASIGNKRPRYSGPIFEDDDDAIHASQAGPSTRRQEKAPAYDEPVMQNGQQRQDEEPLFVGNNEYNDDYDDDDAGGSFGEPAAYDDEEDAHGVSVTPSPVRARAKTKAKAKAKAKAALPPRRQQRDDSYDSESDAGSNYDGRSRGGRSNMRYRSTTPFEDARQQTTRSGRAIMKPLDWWAGESLIWKNGEVRGVTRATSVEEDIKRTNKKRAVHKKKTKKIAEGLDAIDEQDEAMLPSEWEDDIGVLTGEVARYNPATGIGDDEDLETEDLAFAASSIITRAVTGATFNYAKIQTLPFFGSGVVELPPEGFKNTKNSKKMQMNFFVHKGKVQVTITTPTSAQQSEPIKVNVFNITEGGAWVVPRGNNYSIQNTSSTTTALLFFSQGCETAGDLTEAG